MHDPSRLDALRRAVADIEANSAARPGRNAVSLGVSAVDATLGGGLALDAVHEISPSAPAHCGAAAGFALALATLACSRRHVLWIQQDFAAMETGELYGPGLDLLGLPMRQLVVLRVAQARDALWAMEEALACSAVATVITELANDGASADLTATRRLSLAAADGGALGLLLRHRMSPMPSAAMTRWEITSAPGLRDRFGGLGLTAFTLSLVRNRRGPTGRWLLSWDHHECVFSPALSLGVAAAARDRSDRARSFIRAG